jgi:hypothetical protein
MMRKYSGNDHHITSVIEADNQIGVKWLYTAVHVATGKELRLQGCSLYWMDGNLIERGHVYFTSLR